MAACSIFDEDEVCMPTSSGGFKYGLVVESSAYVDSSDDEDDDEIRVKPGTVKVAWHPSGHENIVEEKKLILTDRSLMPGDVVRRLISGKDSQRGFVEAMEVKCHAKILGTEQYIYNIDAKLVTPIQVFDAECEVVLDSWVGHVMEIHEDIVVRFTDGARCCLKNAGLLNLQDMNDKRTDVSEFAMRHFYPGQELAGASEDYEDAVWLNTTNLRGPKQTKSSFYSAVVTVEMVETTALEVRWLCKGFTRTGAGIDKLESPPTRVEGDNLKRMRRLDCFDLCHIQIGDRGYYVVKDTDTVLLNMSPREHVTPDIVNIMAKDNALVIGTCTDGLMVARRGSSDSKGGKGTKSCEEIEDKAMTNGDDQTLTNGGDKVVPNGDTLHEDEGEFGDDEFEDIKEDINEDSDASSSSHSEEVNSISRKKNRKRPSLQTRGMKKLKGKRARRKTKQPEREIRSGDKVPIEVWYTFSTCDVMWQDGTVEKAVPSPELFPIHHLDENEFFPGDYVLDGKGNNSTEYGVIESCDHKERTVVVKWIKPYVVGKTNKPEENTGGELSVYDIKDHQDYKFRAGHTVIRVGGFQDDRDVEAIGQVYKLDPRGTIHVWWPNSTITECFPQDLYIISEEYHSDGGSSDEWTDVDEEEEEEEGDSDVSWETEGEETDADTDTEVKNKKPLWSVSDSKKNDLDELLQRVQAALTGLLNVFINQRGPFFKNSRQVFQDVLAIFKRCKQMEKILKSSYFDDDEIAELISEIKDQLRKETTSKFARHVAQVYKFRTVAGDASANKTKETDAISGKEEDKVDSGTIQEAIKDTSVAGAEGGSEILDSPEEDVREKLVKALIMYGSNIEDPMLQIIFDTTLHTTVAGSARQALEEAKSRNVSPATILSNVTSPTSPTADSREKSVTEMIQSVIISVCDKNYDNLERAFKSAKEKVDLALNRPSSLLCTNTYSEHLPENGSTKSNDGTKESVESPGASVTQPVLVNSVPSAEKTETLSAGQTGSLSLEETGSHFVDKTGSHPVKGKGSETFAEKIVQSVAEKSSQSMEEKSSTSVEENSSQSMEEKNSQLVEVIGSHSIEEPTSQTGATAAAVSDADNIESLPPSHRSLCIRVCKALNVRLLYIQQEVNRRWLAFKFGCSEGASDMELFEKMQAKMIESVEQNGEPLKLVSDNVNVMEDLAKEEEREKEREKMEEEKVNSPEKVEDVDMKSTEVESPVSGSVDSPISVSGEESSMGGEREQPVEGFQMCTETPTSHWYKYQEHKPVNQRTFNAAVRKEYKLLQTSLPDGIFVKAFEDRMDLFSVMIQGPTNTPYEDGLFAFDIQLPSDFPSSPPALHYLSFCNERLNPNLYEDGKVCVSLLGTWAGKGNEVWTSKSSMLQVLVSIQGLILVSEPYFNEAGYEKQRGTQLGQENSTMYNEMAILKLVQSMTKMVLAPPAMFVEETKTHIRNTYQGMIRRIEKWIEISNSYRSRQSVSLLSSSQSGPSTSQPVTTEETCAQKKYQTLDNKEDNSTPLSDKGDNSDVCCPLISAGNIDCPDYPLLPLSKGFCLTMCKHLEVFRTVVKEHLQESVKSDESISQKE